MCTVKCYTNVYGHDLSLKCTFKFVPLDKLDDSLKNTG